jgi:hypothetical protein
MYPDGWLISGKWLIGCLGRGSRMTEEEQRNYNSMAFQRESHEAAADSARLLETALARIKELERANELLAWKLGEMKGQL